SVCVSFFCYFFFSSRRRHTRCYRDWSSDVWLFRSLLLTHSHASLGLKEEFLTEVTHAPLGLLGMLVGWARWLELRLPSPEARIPRWLWSGALAAVGILLILYRES